MTNCWTAADVVFKKLLPRGLKAVVAAAVDEESEWRLDVVHSVCGDVSVASGDRQSRCGCAVRRQRCGCEVGGYELLQSSRDGSEGSIWCRWMM